MAISTVVRVSGEQWRTRPHRDTHTHFPLQNPPSIQAAASHCFQSFLTSHCRSLNLHFVASQQVLTKIQGSSQQTSRAGSLKLLPACVSRSEEGHGPSLS